MGGFVVVVGSADKECGGSGRGARRFMSPRREQPMKLPTNDFPSDRSRVGGGGGGADGRKNGGNERQWRRSVMLVVIF